MLDQLNIKIFNSINQLAGQNAWLDSIAVSFAEYTPYVFILILVYLWFKKREDKNIVLYTTYSATLGVIINRIISFFYYHPRPFAIDLGQTLLDHATDSSFPSDHTTFILSIAILLVYFKRTRKLALFMLTLALFASLARIYVGVHFPFDILASLSVAVLVSLFIFIARNKLKFLNNFLINTYYKIFAKREE